MLSSHELPDDQLDLVFRALGDRTRRRLLARLAEGSAMVTELAKPFAMSLPAVGKHLRVLENAGLVRRTVSGRVHRCALNALPLKPAGEWVQAYGRFWQENLDALDNYIQSADDTTGKSRR
jgi:DNA-binding transcriptional ArsR family regulator